MKDTAHTKKVILILAIINAVFCFGAWFFYDKIMQKNEAASQSQTDIASQNQAIARAASFQLILKNTESSRSQIEKTILTNNQIVPFVEFIEGIAKQNNLTVSVGLDSQPDPASTINTSYLIMTITTKGSWQNTHSFVSLLETMPNAIAITSLDIVKDTTADSTIVADSRLPVLNFKKPNNLSTPEKSWGARIVLQVLQFNK